MTRRFLMEIELDELGHMILDRVRSIEDSVDEEKNKQTISLTGVFYGAIRYGELRQYITNAYTMYPLFVDELDQRVCKALSRLELNSFPITHQGRIEESLKRMEEAA